MKRFARARWMGTLKQGSGTITSESGAFTDKEYNFSKRFGSEHGTNPEELIAAAHSSCFAMAFAGELGKCDLSPESIDVQAVVNLRQVDGSWSVDAISLDVTASVPGGTEEQVMAAANSAKENCPISKLLDAHVTMDLYVVPSRIQELGAGH